MVQQGDVEVELLFWFLYGGGREQGVGFVGEGKYEVGLYFSDVRELFDQGESVKGMSQVYEQGGDDKFGKAGPGCKQGYGYELPGSRIDQYAHDGCIDPVIPGPHQQKAKGHSQGDVSQKYRKGGL